MRRLDLPEIEDSPRCPSWLRDAMTGYLQVVIDRFRPYDACGPVIARLLGGSGLRTILDLGSGAGGPWPGLRTVIVRDGVEPDVVLSDLHPNRRAAARLAGVEGVRYEARAVSALDLPTEPRAMLTMFTGLHHLRPDDVRRLLRSAQDARVPFIAAEATHRSVRGLLVTLLIPLLVLVLMPVVRPRRPLPLLLTYLPPLLPLLIWWDGFASTLRTYRASELRHMAAEVAEPGYSWHVEEITVRDAPIPVTVIVGAARRVADPDS